MTTYSPTHETYFLNSCFIPRFISRKCDRIRRSSKSRFAEKQFFIQTQSASSSVLCDYLLNVFANPSVSGHFLQHQQVQDVPWLQRNHLTLPQPLADVADLKQRSRRLICKNRLSPIAFRLLVTHAQRECVRKQGKRGKYLISRTKNVGIFFYCFEWLWMSVYVGLWMQGMVGEVMLEGLK
jgi:hypothetical protein